MNPFDLNDIPVFLKVVDNGGFSAAARFLNLPKATVSRRVARLEKAVGVRLLQRTTRSLSLTDAGRSYYAECSVALSAVEEATRRTVATQQVVAGTIRMSAPADSGFVVDMIADFLATYPLVRIEVVLTDAHLNLVEKGIDVAFRAGSLPDSSLVARKLGQSRRLFCASPDYLAAAGRPNRPQDLSSHDCVVFGESVDGNTWHFEGPDGADSVQIRSRIAVNAMHVAVRATIAGLGIAQLPATLIRQDLEAGRLEVVLPGCETGQGGFYAVTPSNRLVPTAVKALIDFVAERLARSDRTPAKTDNP